MSVLRIFLGSCLVLALGSWLFGQGGRPLTERPAAAAPEGPPPKLEAVAETRLLMEGLHQPNMQGLARLLKEKPTTAEDWMFARGQALIIAESGNLLMLRPPRAAVARDTWLARSAELRKNAVTLATAAGEKDYVAARAALATVANSCNRCHEAFRVPHRIVPFE